MLSFRAVSIIIMAGFTAMDIARPKHIFNRSVFEPIFFCPFFHLSAFGDFFVPISKGKIGLSL